MERRPIAIIGVGNYLMGDEGVGIHAITRLEAEPWPEGVELIDGGTPGLALMYLLEGRELVILIDCADFGAKPGAIEAFDPEKLARDERAEISLHATDLLSSLTLAKQLGESYPKRIQIVGIQPKTIAMGTALSPEAQGALEHLPAFLRELLPTT